MRGGGDHTDHPGQLWPVQYRHLQRGGQDPLERQLYVAQDPTYSPEQVQDKGDISNNQPIVYFVSSPHIET